MTDADEVRAGVMDEVVPFDRLVASLYNTPTPFSGYHVQHAGGTRFLRWHELSVDQKRDVKAKLFERMDELDVRMSVVHD